MNEETVRRLFWCWVASHKGWVRPSSFESAYTKRVSYQGRSWEVHIFLSDDIQGCEILVLPYSKGRDRWPDAMYLVLEPGHEVYDRLYNRIQGHTNSHCLRREREMAKVQ